MSRKDKALPQNMTDAEMLELLQKTNEQYQVYKELNDVANIVRKPAYPPAKAPSPEHPLTNNCFSIKETQ